MSALIGNLDLLANIYNNILFTLMDVERPMMQAKLDKIDEELKKACTVLSWRSHGINEFIVQSMSLVKEANTILSGLKANVAQIEGCLHQMKVNVMFERKDAKTFLIEDLQAAHETLVSNRHDDAIDHGEKIQKLLLDSNKILRISKGASSWKTYVDYIAGIVIDGTAEAIAASIDELQMQLNVDYLVKNDLNPLFEIKLELIGSDVVYTPEMNPQKNDSLRSSVISWIKDFSNISKLLTRLDSLEGDYLFEIESNVMLRRKIQQLSRNLSVTENECARFADGYGKYEYLWAKDIEECFQEFKYKETDEYKALSEEDLAKGVAPPADAVPTLARFDEEIARYQEIQDEVATLPNSQQITWLTVNCKPIKQAIATWVSKWKYRYTEFLLDDLTTKITDLLAFVKWAQVTLEKEVESGQLDALIEVMGCIRDIRTRTEETDGMFEPLGQAVTLLKKWSVPVPEETLSGLEEAPNLWGYVKKQNYSAKERLLPLQNAEAERIKTEVEAFNADVQTFRNNLKANAPFNYSSKWEDAFVTLRKLHTELTTMEAKAKYLNEMQDLFDLTVTDYRDIRSSRRELTHLKACWDMASMVILTFDDYRRIPWAEINTDALTDECKKLTKIVRSLDKFVKNWNIFKGIEDTVKNMMTSLPLVSDLAHPSMRERHWKLLMKATGKNFTMDDSFSLGDLLALGLHQFVEVRSYFLVFVPTIREIRDFYREMQRTNRESVTLYRKWLILSTRHRRS
eukprot:SAG31_NODE_475_length_15172_cov_4.834273_2_plen_742_part_00